MDGVTTSDLGFDIAASALATALQNMYASINGVTAVNTVAATFGGGAAKPCVDATTTTTTIVFQADSGNLPTLGVVSSITDGGAVAEGAMAISHPNRGSKDSFLCNGIGTCKFDIGKCDCGDYYTFEDAFGGCGKPVVNTSSWVGLETCPGVVLQSDLTLAVDKPSSEARLYFAMR